MRSIGLEIGDGFLRAVEVEGGAKGASIRKFVQAPVVMQEGRTAEDALVEAIDGLFREHSLSRGNVVLSIESTEATLRELSMPITVDEQLKKTVKFEFEHHVHSKSVEDMIVDFYRIEKREKTTQVLAAGVPKPVIQHRLEIAARCGIDPAIIDLDLFSLFNGAVGSGVFEGKPAALHVHLEPKYAKLLAVDEGRLRFVRTIRLSQVGAKAREAAEGVAQSLGGTYHVSSAKAIAEVLNREIARSLLSHPLKQSVSHIIVTGPSELVRGVVPALEELSAIPTESFSPDPEQEEMTASVAALGLAFRGIGLDGVGTDFRKEEFKFERRFETVKKSAFLCLCMVAVLLGLIALYFHNRHREYASFREAILEDARSRVLKVYEKIEPGKAVPAFDDPAQEAKKLLKTLEGRVGKGDHPLPLSALQHWKQVFEQVTGFDYFTIQNLDVNLERGVIDLRGKVSSETVGERLTNQLKSIEGYEVVPGRYEQSGGRMAYNWSIKVPKK